VAAPCFVVEDKHALHEDKGSNPKHFLIAVIFVKSRDAEFYKQNNVPIFDMIISSSK